MKSLADAVRQQIRVVLADDHPVVREGFAAILESQKDIIVVGEATNGEEAGELYERLFPMCSCSIYGCPRRMVCKSSLS
jgi:chemotaxis response regulator CheB